MRYFLTRVIGQVLCLLDIRERHWLVAGLLFYGPMALLLLLAHELHQAQDRLKVQGIQVEAVRRMGAERQAMARTLQVAYGMSEPASDFYAYVYRRAATKHVLPWEVLAATTRIESGFDAAAHSSAGACGLMQLLEPTAEAQCKKLGIPYRKNFTIWNPAVNIYLGASYFNECYRNGQVNPDTQMVEAVKRYLGGSKYRNYANQEIISKYCQDVLQEYLRLSYIYAGVLSKPK